MFHANSKQNTVDPRVDSDRDHRNDPSSHMGGTGHTGTTGHTGGIGGGHTGTAAHTGGVGGAGQTQAASHGTHTTDGAGYGSNATPGSGNTTRTAGPYDSNFASKGVPSQQVRVPETGVNTGTNKIDPRVDSDMDRSRTTGGDVTFR
jgi:hypothetical protein